MRKKIIYIFTIYDLGNFGNRLQNYAVQKIFSDKGYDALSIKNYNLHQTNLLYRTKKIIKLVVGVFKHIRFRDFKDFDQNIKYAKFCVNIHKKQPKKFYNVISKADYCVVGSDQVWNPNHNRLTDFDLLSIVSPRKRIAFSASFGINSLNNDDAKRAEKELSKFKAISVREDIGKEIVKELTSREDVEVLVDPTMLLTANEWDEVSRMPKQFKKIKNQKFILNYFLGELSAERKRGIEKIASKNDCQIINILDKKDPFYSCGPSEFLYLEKHAFLICTDSFHSSVFAILYNRPFVVFEREQKNIQSMNSRIDTLINKFQLKERRYNGHEITQGNLHHDYSNAYKILKIERQKSMDFLDKALGGGVDDDK